MHPLFQPVPGHTIGLVSTVSFNTNANASGTMWMCMFFVYRNGTVCPTNFLTAVEQERYMFDLFRMRVERGLEFPSMGFQRGNDAWLICTL